MRRILYFGSLQWLLVCVALPVQAFTCDEYLALDAQLENLFWEYEDEREYEEKYSALEEKVESFFDHAHQQPEGVAYQQLNEQIDVIKTERRFWRTHGRRVHLPDVRVELRDACKKQPNASATNIYTQKMVEAMEPLTIGLEYLGSMKGELEGAAQTSPSTRRLGQLCNRRDYAAFVAISRYIIKMETFKTAGWFELSPQRCMDIQPHHYTYISWHDRSTYATPPRRYSSIPKGRFCLKKSKDFYVFNSNSEARCKFEGGVMKTFLKYGYESESLD